MIEWFRHQPGGQSETRRAQFKRGGGAYVALFALALVQVCFGPASNEGTASFRSIQPITEVDLLASRQFISFTCGCDPCVAVGKELQPRSESMTCISFLPEREFAAFLSKVGWRGRCFVDPGAMLMTKYRMLECPVVARVQNGALKEVKVSEALDVSG